MVNQFGVRQTKWKAPQVRMQLTCTGGLLGKRQEPVDAAQHPITHGTFVKMTKSQRWLQRIVTGVVQHTALNSCALLDTLVKKMMAYGGHGNGPPLDEDGLMSELAYDDDVNDPPAANASNASSQSSHIPLNAILEVAMPAICPTAHVHCDGKTRTVKLWYRGKRCVWLLQDDIEWATSYMRAELDTCGVPPLNENDSELASDHVERQSLIHSQVPYVGWDFSREAWAISRPGQAPLFFALNDLQPHDIPSDHGALGSSSAQAYFSTLSYEAKKELAREAALRLAM